MLTKSIAHHYVMAVYPSATGIAFALFEGSLSLIDWGTAVRTGKTKNERCIQYLERLIDRYVPDVIIVQDTEQPGTRRSARVRALYRAIELLATLNGIDVARYGRVEVNQAFDAAGALTKEERARLAAAMLPALSPRLPPRRRAWMSEHPRMPLFEAASLGLAHYFHEHRRDRTTN